MWRHLSTASVLTFGSVPRLGALLDEHGMRVVVLLREPSRITGFEGLVEALLEVGERLRDLCNQLWASSVRNTRKCATKRPWRLRRHGP